MNLLVDIGNSRIKWARHNAAGMSAHQAVFYDKSDFTDLLDTGWKIISPPDRILVSNVAGKNVAAKLAHWVTKHWQMKPEFVEVTNTAYGVKNAYADISQLGIDRWLAVIATWNKYHSAACIVDCGTAITIDGLGDTGQHLGGLIIPGREIMQQALFQQTHAISEPGDVTVNSGFANNTAQGVVTGCSMAIATLIDRIVHDMCSEFAEKLTCVITGGGADDIINLVSYEFVHEPHLVMQGLSLIAGGNS